jgi:hypothetical protein
MHMDMLRDALVHKYPCPPYNTHEAQIAHPHQTQDIAPDTWQALDSLTMLGTILRKGWRSISPDLGRLVPFRQIGVWSTVGCICFLANDGGLDDVGRKG